jgi:hypothetical protein
MTRAHSTSLALAASLALAIPLALATVLALAVTNDTGLLAHSATRRPGAVKARVALPAWVGPALFSFVLFGAHRRRLDTYIVCADEASLALPARVRSALLAHVLRGSWPNAVSEGTVDLKKPNGQQDHDENGRLCVHLEAV